jgi:hypothetical protein
METAVAQPKHRVVTCHVVSNHIHAGGNTVLSQSVKGVSRLLLPLFLDPQLFKEMTDDLHLPLQRLRLLPPLEDLHLCLFTVLHSHVTEFSESLV